MTIEQNAKVRIIATFAIGTGSKAQNVYHMNVDNVGPHDDADVLADAAEFIEYAMDAVKNYVSTDLDLESVEGYEYVLGDWQPFGSIGSTWAGSATGDRLPAGVACLVKFNKERTGHTDRKFLPGVVEAQCAGDQFSSAMVTAGNAYASRLVAGYVGTQGTSLSCVSKGVPAGSWKNWESGITQQTVSYQRRRKPGVGLT